MVISVGEGRKEVLLTLAWFITRIFINGFWFGFFCVHVSESLSVFVYVSLCVCLCVFFFLYVSASLLCLFVCMSL